MGNANTVRGSFTAKTVLRGNPAGSIAPVGRAALGISTLSGRLRPTPDLSSLEKTTRRETKGGGRGQRRSRRATDGARSGSRPPLRLCGPNFPRTLLGKCRFRRLWQIECVLPRCLSRFFQEVTETQGMGTVERPEGPNGEVPSGKFGSLEAWRLGVWLSLHLSRACRAFCDRGRFGALRLHALFSVLCFPWPWKVCPSGCTLRGGGAALKRGRRRRGGRGGGHIRHGGHGRFRWIPDGCGPCRASGGLRRCRLRRCGRRRCRAGCSIA